MKRAAVTTELSLCLLASASVAQTDAPVLPTTIAPEAGKDGAPADPLATVRHPDLERLFGEGKAKEGLRIAKARLAKDPDDVELYIHTFRFLFDEGERIGEAESKSKREARYKEMLKLVETGLKLAPGHPRLLWGKGIALARLGTTRGVIGSLGNAKKIVTAWEAVIKSGYRYQSPGAREVLPCDAYLALSIIYRLVPDLWVMGAMSGVRGDLDKSLRYAKKSDRCHPGRIQAEKELGVVQLCLGKERNKPELVESGKQALQKVLNRKPVNNIDRLDLRHAEQLMEDPSLACGYSRDGQQARNKK